MFSPNGACERSPAGVVSEETFLSRPGWCWLKSLPDAGALVCILTSAGFLNRKPGKKELLERAPHVLGRASGLAAAAFLWNVLTGPR